jgi:hypothetical protein
MHNTMFVKLFTLKSIDIAMACTFEVMFREKKNMTQSLLRSVLSYGMRRRTLW